MTPVALAYNLGFSPKELRKIEAIVADNRQHLLEEWHGYFGA